MAIRTGVFHTKNADSIATSGVRLSRYIGLSRYLRLIKIKIIQFFI